MYAMLCYALEVCFAPSSGRPSILLLPPLPIHPPYCYVHPSIVPSQSNNGSYGR